MSRTIFARGLAAAAAGVCTATAHAAVLQITFSGPRAVDVPLDPWSTVAASLLIAAAAYAWFRRYGGRSFGRFGVWLAVVAATATMIFAARLDVISTANAAAVEFLSLVSSPDSVDVGTFGNFVVATNNTSSPIVIESVDLLNPIVGQSISQPNTTCVPGLVLQPGATCDVSVDYFSEP